MSTPFKRGQARTSIVVAVCLLTALLLLGCSSSSAGGDDTGLPTLELVNGRGETAKLKYELADTPNERGLGLSNRTSLARDAGMLFDIPELGTGFWMKDTLIPLSVAFISGCGRIVHIAHMQPQTLDVHNTSEAYRFGLEVNQGWFEANRLAVGDSVKLPSSLRQPGC